MWISRKNVHFRSTAWAIHMKLSVLLLSLGNSSRVTEVQVRGFFIGARWVQAFRQRPHLQLKVTLEIPSRGTEACPCPSTAGRQSTSRLHKRAWWCAKPLSRASDPGMDTRACGVPCVRCPPTTHGCWLPAARTECAPRVTAKISTRLTDTQIIPPFLILVFSATLFHKSSPRLQENPSNRQQNYHPLKCGFNSNFLFSHVLQTYFTERSLKRNILIPSQTKL